MSITWAWEATPTVREREGEEPRASIGGRRKVSSGAGRAWPGAVRRIGVGARWGHPTADGKPVLWGQQTKEEGGAAPEEGRSRGDWTGPLGQRRGRRLLLLGLLFLSVVFDHACLTRKVCLCACGRVDLGIVRSVNRKRGSSMKHALREEMKGG